MGNMYDINEKIKFYADTLCNETTGEVDEEALQKLDALEMDKHDKIHGIALSCLEKRGHVAGFKSEIARLKKIVDRLKKEDEYLVHMLDKIVLPGENITADQYQIKRSKSTAVLLNDDFDIEDLEDEFITTKIQKDPNKKTIMAELKKKGMVPGCSIQHKETLKIS